MAVDCALPPSAPALRWRGRAITVAVLTCVLSALTAVAPSPDATAGGPGAATYLSRMNHERADQGIAALTSMADLTAVADRWAAHMAATGRLEHNPQLTSEVSNWRSVGENVGRGPTVDDLDRAFYASPEHRANILDPDFSEVGVGAARSSGNLWIAVVFRDPLSHPSTERPPSTAATPVAPVAAPAVRPGVIALGATGRPVQRVQRLLSLKTRDGVFDARTQHAVRLFQRSFGLRVDGRVGPRTLAMLRDVRARFAAAARLVKYGSPLPSAGPDGTPSLGCMTRNETE
jgi:uncharacterized protein YkwD